MANRLRSVLGQAKRSALRFVRRNSGGSMYYSFVSSAFSREHDAVHAGVQRNAELEARGDETFELRRRIHMLEKGLTMRPRRAEFAVDYIERVVEKCTIATQRGLLTPNAQAWARDVLRGYFGATASSRHPAIIRARAAFAAIQFDEEMPYSGPIKQGRPQVVPTEIEMMERLAIRRRSTRWYSADVVPRECVERAIAVAVEAPTACNRVPYRFIVFDKPHDATRIASLAGGTRGYADNLTGLVAVVGDLSAYVEERDRHLIYIDGGLASMSLIHAFEAQGIATCCINWPDVAGADASIAEAVGLAPWERVVMLIAFGYADPDGLAPQSPKPELPVVAQFFADGSA